MKLNANKNKFFFKKNKFFTKKCTSIKFKKNKKTKAA